MAETFTKVLDPGLIFDVEASVTKHLIRSSNVIKSVSEFGLVERVAVALWMRDCTINHISFFVRFIVNEKSELHFSVAV